MNSYKGCSQATAIRRLLTQDKEFHSSVGSTGQGVAVWSSQQCYPCSNPAAFIGPTDFPSLSLEVLLQDVEEAVALSWGCFQDLANWYLWSYDSIFLCGHTSMSGIVKCSLLVLAVKSELGLGHSQHLWLFTSGWNCGKQVNLGPPVNFSLYGSTDEHRLHEDTCLTSHLAEGIDCQRSHGAAEHSNIRTQAQDHVTPA